MTSKPKRGPEPGMTEAERNAELMARIEGDKRATDSSEISSRSMWTVGALLVALGGGAYFLAGKACDKGDSSQETEQVQGSSSFLNALRPHVQSEFNLPASVQQFNEVKSQYYPVSFDVQAWITQLKRVADIGYDSDSPEGKKLVAKLIEDVLKSGVFDELAKLRALNEKAVAQKKVNISLVPIAHWDPETGEMSPDGVACSRDVEAIVATVRKFSPKSKMFMEGIDVKGLVTAETLLQSIASIQQRKGKITNPSESTGYKLISKYYPWLLDGKSEVYGLEHSEFYQTYMQHMDSQEFKRNVSQASMKSMIILFQQLLREQLAVERAISKVGDGEMGYIFYGAAHITGMSHYLEDRYKGKVEHGAIVPKHLVVRD